jgi:hypothetical protein
VSFAALNFSKISGKARGSPFPEEPTTVSAAERTPAGNVLSVAALKPASNARLSPSSPSALKPAIWMRPSPRRSRGQLHQGVICALGLCLEREPNDAWSITP